MSTRRLAALGTVLVLVVACSSSNNGESPTTAGQKPDPVAYAGGCATDDDCVVIAASDCSQCPPARVAVLTSRREAFSSADADYRAACSKGAVQCANDFQAGPTARCRASACQTDAIVAPPKAESFAAGCTADTDCVIVGGVGTSCCGDCGSAVLKSREAEFTAAVSQHRADCKRANATPCPSAPCPGLSTAICAPGTGTRSCVRK